MQLDALQQCTAQWWTKLPPAKTTARSLLVFLVASLVCRHLVFDNDPHKCQSLIRQGHWYDTHRWLVPGCDTIYHDGLEINSCAGHKTRKIVFAGDTHLQGIFWAIAHRLDHDLVAPSRFEKKDFAFSKNHIELEYLWDPYLNGTSLLQHIDNFGNADPHRPMLTVVGAGNWHAQRGTIEDYTSTVRGIAEKAYPKKSHSKAGARGAFTYKDGPGDLLLFAPADPPSTSRRSSNGRDVSSYRRLNAALRDLDVDNIIDVLWSFEEMLHGRKHLYKSNGKRVTQEVSRRRADVLLNLRCNANVGARGHFPNRATCCAVWRGPNLFQRVFLLLGLVVLPVAVLVDLRIHIISESSRPIVQACSAFTSAISLQFLADRTHVFEQVARLDLVRSNLGGMIVAALVIGFVTIRRCMPARRPNPDEKVADQPFLPRDQTDEWKGWMQVLIITYHYNEAWTLDQFWQLIRLCVSSYLFLSGFGHTVYFLQKKDYSLKRFVSIMIRTNLLPCTLAYVMRTRWLMYYYMPLSTFWFVVIYVTLALGRKYNDYTPFLLIKIASSAWGVHTFLSTKDLPETVVTLFSITCKISFSAAKFFHQRVDQDKYIVYVGMLAAIFYLWAKDVLASDKRQDIWSRILRRAWPLFKCMAITLAAAGLCGFWYWSAHLKSQSDFTVWQPYVAALPILAFTILRNAHPVLRNFHSVAFAWLGRYSAEMYVMQDHLWLAGDQEAVLRTGIFHGNDTVAGDRWRDLLIVTPMYLIACSVIGDSTGVIANWFVEENPPTPLQQESEGTARAVAEVELGLLAGADSIEDEEPAIMKEMIHRKPKWLRRVMRLPSLSPARLKHRVYLVLAAMWLLNMTYK